MGNCLVRQDKKAIRIMTMDGTILRYPSPLKVHQALAEFPGHTISDALPAARYLDPAADMRRGQLYYLLPPKEPIVEAGFRSGTIRIKLVLTKQELKEMLSKGGVSLGSMASLLQREPSNSGEEEDEERCVAWRPALESIPEGGDFY